MNNPRIISSELVDSELYRKKLYVHLQRGSKVISCHLVTTELGRMLKVLYALPCGKLQSSSFTADLKKTGFRK